MAAERETIDRLIAHFLADRIGATFDGRISGVTRSGLFVKLAETGADGLIPTAPSAPITTTMTRPACAGRRTQRREHRLGDVVDVRLVEAAPVAGALRFELLSEGHGHAARRGRRPGAGDGKGAKGRAGASADRTPGKAQEVDKTRGKSGDSTEGLRPAKDRPRTVTAHPPESLGRRTAPAQARPVDRPEARLRPLPALRRGQAVSRLPENRRPLRGVRTDFTHHRADDLPAYIVIVIVGHIVVRRAALGRDELWPTLAALPSLPLTVVLSLLLLQPVKGAVVGLQWALRMHGFDDRPERDNAWLARATTWGRNERDHAGRP